MICVGYTLAMVEIAVVIMQLNVVAPCSVVFGTWSSGGGTVFLMRVCGGPSTGGPSTTGSTS